MHKKEMGSSHIILLLIILIIIAIAGAAWYVWDKNKDKDTNTTNQNTSQNNNSSDDKSSDDPTDDWVVYSNTPGSFSFRHPASWVFAANPEICTDSLVLIAPTAETVGRCATEFSGEISASSVAGDERASFALDPAVYTSITSTPVTINGVTGTKQTGTINMTSEIGGLPTDTETIQYTFFTGGRSYIISYHQQPGYPDVSDDFETIVTRTFRFEPAS